MVKAFGEADEKGGAMPFLAFDAYGTAVELDQILDKGETDAGAFKGAACCALDPVETFKDVWEFLEEMPMPVSETVNSTSSPASCKEMAMVPSKVNLKALDRRLRTIFSHMPRST